MRTLSIVLAVVLNVIVGPAVSAQITDWRALFRDLVSADRTVSDAARARAFDTLLPKLQVADPESLNKDLTAVIETLDEEPIRFQASALLAGLAMLRPDGSEALKRVLPVFVSQFADQDKRIRQNAILAIANLQPQVPSEALPALIEAVSSEAREDDPTATAGAIYALARLGQTSSVAVSEVARLLSADQPAEIRIAALGSIARARMSNPEIIAKLGEVLREDDHNLIKEAIRAVSKIGPAAAAVRAGLQRIADNETDKELAKEAAAAILRLGQ